MKHEVFTMVNEIWQAMLVFCNGIGWEDAERRRNFMRLIYGLLFYYGVVPFIFGLFGANVPTYIKAFIPKYKVKD